MTTLIRSEWVDTTPRLVELCQQWRGQDCLAVDTEFMRTDTFYPILGLIQVSDGDRCWLVDPLAIADFTPFRDVLLDASIVKVLHACSEDLEVLWYALQVVPTPIFDTQVAAAYAGYGFSRGYAALVGDVTTVQLQKHETRSDWLQRPLSEAQLSYAAEDVYYLVQIYRRLTTEIAASNRLSWVWEEMRQLLERLEANGHVDEYYLKVKSAWQLQPKELAALKSLTTWREHEARAQDKPRNRVVSDRVLWEIARRQPANLRDLSRLPDVHPRVRRQYGEQLLALIADLAQSSPESWPQRLPQPLPREAGAILKKLRAAQVDVAEQLNVAPEVLARKKDLEVIAASALNGEARLPQDWQGTWRETVIGQALLLAAKV